MSLQAQDRPADEESHERGESGADDKRDGRRQAEMGGPDRDRVGADPHETGMAETHLPSETHQQVQSDGGERKYEHQSRDAIVIGGRKKHWQHHHDYLHRQRWHKSMSQEPLHEALEAMSSPLSRRRSGQPGGGRSGD